MDTVNQLLSGIFAKVLRINQTTDATIRFEYEGFPNAISCYGWKDGYENARIDCDGYPQPDISFASGFLSEEFTEQPIEIDTPDAEQKLRALLESLNKLERELITNAE